MLTPAQCAAYHRDGFVVIPDAVDAKTCRALHERALSWTRDADLTQPMAAFSTVDHQHADEQWFLESGDTIRLFFEPDAHSPDGQLAVPLAQAFNKAGHALHRDDPLFALFSSQARWQQLADALGLRRPAALQSMFLYKAAGTGGEVSCHTDHSFLRTEPSSVVGLWFALADADRSNGCMWALPGSHREPVRQRFVREGSRATLETLDATPYDLSDAVPLEVRQGSLIVLHGHLPHFSHPNHSARPRPAYTLHVIEADATYPPDNWLVPSWPLPLLGTPMWRGAV